MLSLMTISTSASKASSVSSQTRYKYNAYKANVFFDSQMSTEQAIQERINSQLYSDVIASYVDINNVTSQRNIVSGSYKETVVQCTDQTLATLNSAGGQTLFTRFKLTPQVRNATLAQLAQIYFQYYIPKNSLGLILHKMPSNTEAEDITDASTQVADNLTNGTISEAIKFKLFYDSGFSIASMVQLCLVADAKVSTENFNYQQSLLTLNSLPDFVTDNSSSESTLKALVHNEHYRGVGSGLLRIRNVTYDASTAPDGAVSDATTKVLPIPYDIGIEGVIDLDRGNPLFHNFPIITRNMGELYIRLYMENFLRELKIVYLNKSRVVSKASLATGATITGNHTAASYTQNGDIITLTAATNATTQTYAQEYLPYQRLPADKADFIFLDGDLYKVRLVNLENNAAPASAAKFSDYANPIYSFTKVTWTRFEIRKVEFDVEDYEEIKSSQARAGTYKFPVHLFRSKNFDQTNAASSSSNALQTTLNAPNIDRVFITQPLTRDYYTFLPTLAVTDINPQLHNNPVLPRTEDDLNARTCERIYNVFTDTDKYSAAQDLVSSTDLPTVGKQLWIKGSNTYGGAGAYVDLQRGIAVSNIPYILPNKFAYALELNEDGCFRRGFNSVIDGGYSPTVPINLQQSTQTSANIYYKLVGTTSNSDIVNKSAKFNAAVAYGDIRDSGAVASVHCLCDYIFWISFDQYGMMTDFGVSEYNDRQ